MSQLDDFLKGTPLNEELKRLRDGQVEGAQAQDLAELKTWDIEDPERPLDDTEREDLAKLLLERGWRVLERLRKRTCENLERAATLASRNNPLQNAEKIAAGWAQLAIYEQALETEAALIRDEIRKLKEKGTEKATPDES